MTTSRLASLRLAGPASLALAALMALGACSTESSTPTPSLDPMPSGAPSETPVPTASPSPTPAPTPRFTNEPDEDLAALIPTELNGVSVVIAPWEEFALTPGDVGSVYGELGNRFASLAVAYTEQPRLTLYAVRVDGETVETDDLEPHLATAGRYVGIAGLDPDPWERGEAGGHEVWVRPEDNATAAGTMIYTWSSGEFVFLLIGVDDAVNRAMIAQLPGQPATTPRPSATEAPSTEASASPGSDE